MGINREGKLGAQSFQPGAVPSQEAGAGQGFAARGPCGPDCCVGQRACSVCPYRPPPGVTFVRCGVFKVVPRSGLACDACGQRPQRPGPTTGDVHFVEAACPVCAGPAVVDRPDLRAMDATCRSCGWHFTTGAADVSPRAERSEAECSEAPPARGERLGVAIVLGCAAEELRAVASVFGLTPDEQERAAQLSAAVRDLALAVRGAS